MSAHGPLKSAGTALPQPRPHDPAPAAPSASISISTEASPLRHLYAESTQARRWLFADRAALRARREAAAAAAADRIAGHLHTEAARTPLQLVSADEQLQLCAFFEAKILDYGAAFKLHPNIPATAIVLFKRFYIDNSVMDYHPMPVLHTCIFLACKIENSFFSDIKSLATYLSRVPNAPAPSEILELEYVVCQATGFNFLIHHPFWPLYGFYLHLLESVTDPVYADAVPAQLEAQRLQAVLQTHTVSTKLATRALLTDLPLLYWPSQIALACMRIAARENGTAEELAGVLDAFSQSVPSSAAITHATLLEKLDAIESILNAYSSPKKEALVGINQKLKTCENPAHLIGTETHRRLVSEEERREAQRRREKHEKQHLGDSNAGMVKQESERMSRVPKRKQSETSGSGIGSPAGAPRDAPPTGGAGGQDDVDAAVRAAKVANKKRKVTEADERDNVFGGSRNK